MSAEEIKPCPFCGGCAALVPHQDDGTYVGVFCQTEGCGAHAGKDWFMPKSEAINAWNRRSDIKETGTHADNNARAEILPPTCPNCHGEGHVQSSAFVPCYLCNGSGKTSPVA